MKTALSPVLLVLIFSGCIAFRLQTPEQRQAWAQETTGYWSNFSRVTADKFLAEYGPPNVLKADRLIWYGGGPWKRVEVWDAAPYYDSDGGETDLEQTVRHHVPADKRPALAAFGNLIRIPKNGDEISARCGSEELDFLAINLAHQVIAGSMTAPDARRSFDRIAELTASGKSSPYTQGFLFAPEP